LDDLARSLIISDCTNHSLFNQPDVILHFAGISSLPECEAYPVKAYKNNVNSTASILDYARKNKCKIIFASTSAVYENNEGILEESLLVKPSLVYANTKYAAENLCKSFANNYGLDIIICRFFNVFGPNQDFTRKNPPFTSALVKAIRNDTEFTLYNNSSEAVRDYIYVDDLIHILKKMIYSTKNYNGEVFNLTSGLSYSTLDIISALEIVASKKLNYIMGDAVNFWSKYKQLDGLNVNILKHEISKSSVGLNKKIISDFLDHNYTFITMKDGLNNILKYQGDIN